MNELHHGSLSRAPLERVELADRVGFGWDTEHGAEIVDMRLGGRPLLERGADPLLLKRNAVQGRHHLWN